MYKRQVLTHFTRLTKLTRIHLLQVKVTQPAQLRLLRNLPELADLSLAGAAMDVACAAEIGKLVSLRHLIVGPGFGRPLCAAALRELAGLTKLIFLDISGNFGVGDMGRNRGVAALLSGAITRPRVAKLVAKTPREEWRTTLYPCLGPLEALVAMRSLQRLKLQACGFGQNEVLLLEALAG